VNTENGWRVTVDKVIVDGKVAVLVSGGFGAGWSTWQDDDECNQSMAFEPKVVEMILAGLHDKNRAERKVTKDKIAAYMAETYPDLFAGGIDGLKVVWVPQGAKFHIEEYDGNETLVLQYRWLTA
jgi:hypothetical protein